jgi:tRNA threonylcarbamoyladenosine biosynthesis protein TsaB
MILGIETATSICGAGIAEGERVVAEIRFDIKNLHAEVLSESIEQLLRLAGISSNRIEAYAISIGPGSFTGLRIGLATAKGLAFVGEKPLVPVSTLLAQAGARGRGQRAEGRGQRAEGGGQKAEGEEQMEVVVPVIKARQGEIFTARFREAWPIPLAESDEVLLSMSEFPEWLKSTGLHQPVFLCGNGVPMLQERRILEQLSNLVIVPEAAAMLGGGLVARLGAIKFAAGEAADLATLEPRYLQAFETGPRKT